MFPLKDDNPSLTRPVVTIGLIILNVVVFIYQWITGLTLASLKYALIPAALTGAATREGVAYFQYHVSRTAIETLHIQSMNPELLSLFTSMFMHGSWMHLLGNMWFLWIFGNNVEDVLGKGKFLGFYLLCGVGAALAQVVLGPTSVIPMVGASGAIAGVLGAYLVLFPGSRVLNLLFLFVFITTIELPASIVLGYWFLLNLVSAFVGIGGKAAGGGVAYMAHIGGFALGWLLIKLWGSQNRLPPPSEAQFTRSRGFGGWG